MSVVINPEASRHVHVLDGDDVVLAGIIAAVNANGTINVACFAEDGRNFGLQEVPLIQPGQGVTRSAGGFYARWMPYTVAQAEAAAAKTTALPPTANTDGASTGS